PGALAEGGTDHSPARDRPRAGSEMGAAESSGNRAGRVNSLAGSGRGRRRGLVGIFGIIGGAEPGTGQFPARRRDSAKGGGYSARASGEAGSGGPAAVVHSADALSQPGISVREYCRSDRTAGPLPRRGTGAAGPAGFRVALPVEDVPRGS